MIKSVMVHFDDLDAVGILHNARYAVLLERAIAAFWRENGVYYPEVVDVVREYTITFHTPVRSIGEVEVEFWVETLGRTSIVFGFRFQTDSLVYAEGKRANVCIDPAGRPAPWPDKVRAMAALATMAR